MDPWARPFLRWAGSKRSLLPHLVEYYRAVGGRYIEPFSGSACLFFATHPKSAVIADRNAELMRTYETLRAHPRRIVRLMHDWPTSRACYYQIRAMDEDSLDPVSRAARFIYLNRTCFNGLYRTDRRGRFNVPYGTRTGRLPTEQHLYRCSVALRRADLRCGDFAATTYDAGHGDFVYLDPPYTSAPQHAYGVYGYGSFRAADMNRMLDTLHRLDSAGATFLFSYADVPSIIERLPEAWSITRVNAPGQIAGKVSARTRRSEVLVTNRVAQRAMPA